MSIRQPWAWFIIEGWKPIENRDWPAPAEVIGTNILIHASKALTRKEFDSACSFAAKCGATMFPDFDRLHRGGIVGMVKLARCVRASSSPWFTGKVGFVLTEPYPLPFQSCPGQLGFFTPAFL